MGSGRRRVSARALLRAHLPSYIPDAHFAAAVQWLAARLPENERIPFQHLQEVAVGIHSPAIDAAAAPPDVRAAALGAFFAAMGERLSGRYRRSVQTTLLLCGLLLATVFNIDTLRIMRELSQNAELRNAVVERALNDALDSDLPPLAPPCRPAKAAQAANQAPPETTQDAKAPTLPDCGKEITDGIRRRVQYASTLGLPIGWGTPLPDSPQAWLSAHRQWLPHLPGWLLTALALTLGAPFWFDLLSRLADLRHSLKAQQKPPPDPPTQPPASAP